MTHDLKIGRCLLVRRTYNVVCVYQRRLRCSLWFGAFLIPLVAASALVVMVILPDMPLPVEIPQVRLHSTVLYIRIYSQHLPSIVHAWCACIRSY